jgi:GNAT superfamily N-acetyltransferase
MSPPVFHKRLADDDKLLKWVRSRFRLGIEAGAWPEYRSAPDGREPVVVIDNDTRSLPAGFATYLLPYPRRAFVWIDLIWVEPTFRRQGIASALLRAIGDKHGPCHLQFGTLADNAPMNALAQRLGWRAHATTYEGFSQ